MRHWSAPHSQEPSAFLTYGAVWVALPAVVLKQRKLLPAPVLAILQEPSA